MQQHYKNFCFLSNEIIEDEKKHILAYLKRLKGIASSGTYENDESSLCLVDDSDNIKKVREILRQKSVHNLRYILNIGIGGSNLGTKAIYDALYGYMDLVEPNRYPKMFFLDTNDTEFMNKTILFLKDIKNTEELFIHIISKSGGTTETIVNAEVVLHTLHELDEKIYERVVVTTDENSPLWMSALEKNISTLSIPKKVGGRYSVFSAVGLFPLMAAGVDIDGLLRGALQMRGRCIQEQDNPAVISAIFLSHFFREGKNIHDLFVFHPELESIGKWYRQLMGESLGKDGKGITPTVSVGSTDLHSVGQLYLGGPKDKTTCFVSAASSIKVEIPKTLTFPLIENIQGKSLYDVMSAIQQGTQAAYFSQKIPAISVVLDDISPFSLGEFMQYKMIEMMLLGQLLNVNAFDQPHVELYKKETKKILKNQQGST